MISGEEQQKNSEFPSKSYENALNPSTSYQNVQQPSISYQSVSTPSITYQNVQQPFTSYQNIPPPSISYQDVPSKTVARTSGYSITPHKSIVAIQQDINDSDLYGSGMSSWSTKDLFEKESPFALPELYDELLTVDNNDFNFTELPKRSPLITEAARDNKDKNYYSPASDKTNATRSETLPTTSASFNREPGKFDLIELVYSTQRDLGTLPSNMISRNENNKTIVTVKVPKNTNDIEEFYGFIYSHMYKYEHGKGKLFILSGFTETTCNMNSKVFTNSL